MKRTAALFLIGLGLAARTDAMAQGAGTIPVTSDVRRVEQVEQRIETRIEQRTGTRGEAGAGTPRIQSDPSGVAGFNGPPGPIGDSVGSYGALPQGAAGADIR